MTSHSRRHLAGQSMQMKSSVNHFREGLKIPGMYGAGPLVHVGRSWALLGCQVAALAAPPRTVTSPQSSTNILITKLKMFICARYGEWADAS